MSQFPEEHKSSTHNPLSDTMRMKGEDLKETVKENMKSTHGTALRT